MERLNIDVLFCGDAVYFQHMGVAIASLLKSNPTHTFRIFVCTERAVPDAENRLSAFVSEFGNASVTFLNFSIGQCRDRLYVGHLAVAAYLRLFVSEFLDPTIGKVLYLDGDVIVCGDVGELWQTDLAGAFVAAVPDPTIHSHLGFERGDTYFNSGVLIIDVAKWRAANVLPEFLQFAIANTSLLTYFDQDVLNSVLRGKIKALDYRWNFQTSFPGLQPEILGRNSESFKELRRSPSIIHFTTEYKPWFYMYEPHYKKLYYDALALTPWRDYHPPDRTPRSIVLKLVKMTYVKERVRWYAPRFAQCVTDLFKKLMPRLYRMQRT